jgi:WD40 repeat protein/transcriptional regulator with XRE-family HTH domain
MDPNPTFGQWLKARRRALDLTQDALAERVGCAGETIRKVEANGIRPSKQLADLLAGQLDLTADERAAFVAWARGSGAPAVLLAATPSAAPAAVLHGATAARVPALARVPAQATAVVAPAPPANGNDGKRPNPYKGLRAFQEADAPDFFGRETLTAHLLTRLAETTELARFLAVVGPSGSGKSSVVRAGLLPALRAGAVPGSARWTIVEMIPGAHPLEELEAVLLRVAVNPPTTLLDQLQADTRGLLRAVKRVLPQDPAVELLLVIDQFEEVFTLLEDEAARVHFLDSLYVAVADPSSRLRVVITLRADFYDRPLLYPPMAELLRARTELVPPMPVEDLERAIVRPAARVGAGLEPELVTAIIADVGTQPGVLPLVQYALTELYERTAGPNLELAAYRASGSVQGALGRRAEEIYAALAPAEQEATRQLFLRLITLGEGAEDTRRRVRLAEVASLSREPGLMQRVVERFARYRLLTLDRDPATGGATVEVAHEALLRAWERLREWLDASRNDLRLQRQLGAAAGEWARAGQDASYLATGARLAQFEALAGWGNLALTAEEQTYLARSVAERERQAAVERARQEQELTAARRTATALRSAADRLRLLVTGLAVFLLVAAVLTVFAFSQQAEASTQREQAQQNAAAAQHSAATAVANKNAADSQRQLAEANLTRSEALRLAGEANRLLQTGDPSDLVALLALRSMQTQYSPQGDAALAAAARLPQTRRIFAEHDNIIHSVAFAPDGKTLLTASEDGSARLWNVQSSVSTGALSTSAIPAQAGSLWAAAYSPDGRFVLLGGTDYTAILWEIRTAQGIRRFQGHGGPVKSVAFSPDGKYGLTGSGDKMARLWDVQSGQTVQTFTGHTGAVNHVAFSPDGKLVLTASDDTTARLWDVATGHEIRRFTGHTDKVNGAAFAPDGKTILTGSSDATARLWDATTGLELERLTGHTAAVEGVAFTPDGRSALTASDDKTARLWDLRTGQELRRFAGHTAAVLAVTVSSDGQWVLTGSADNTARLWAAQEQPGLPQLVGHTAPVGAVAFSHNGQWIASGGGDYTARLWDAVTGREVGRLSGHTGAVTALAFSPDDAQVLTGSADTTVRLWDRATMQPIRTFSGHTDLVNSVAFSPDGTQIVTSGVDSYVRLWDARSARQLFPFYFGAASVDFSPDGHTIRAGGGTTVKVWDTHTDRALPDFGNLTTGAIFGHASALSAMACAPDQKHLVTGTADGTVRLWDTATHKEVHRLATHLAKINQVAFSPDGTLALAAVNDGTARLWDVATGQEVRRLAGHTAAVTGAVFSPDGKQVLTGSADRTARLWYTDYHDTMRRLCAALPRDFTADERTQYNIADTRPTCP